MSYNSYFDELRYLIDLNFRDHLSILDAGYFSKAMLKGMKKFLEEVMKNADCKYDPKAITKRKMKRILDSSLSPHAYCYAGSGEPGKRPYSNHRCKRVPLFKVSDLRKKIIEEFCRTEKPKKVEENKNVQLALF